MKSGMVLKTSKKNDNIYIEITETVSGSGITLDQALANLRQNFDDRINAYLVPETLAHENTCGCETCDCQE